MIFIIKEYNIMATSPDDKVITRDSLKKGLEEMYNDRSKAGGTFSAYAAGKNTMILGTQSPFGYTQKSRELTIEPGFTTKVTLGKENYKEEVLRTDNHTKYKAGFNNRKYTDSLFSRLNGRT